MAYLHCHTPGCNWSQDDFWTLRFRIRYNRWQKKWWKRLSIDIGYNPISRILHDVYWLIIPQWRTMDEYYLDEMIKHTGVKVWFRQREKKLEHLGWDKPYTEYQVFTWQWLIVELVSEWKNIRNMKWWTWKRWKNVRNSAVCPRCGLRNFDID